MNTRSKVDAALALLAVILALIVALAGDADGAVWLRWVVFGLTVALLLRVLRAGAVARGDSLSHAAPELSAAIDAEVRRCRRTGRPMSVVLVEIDRFEELDDKHGEGSAQAAEHQVTELLRSSAREIDLVSHLGGGQYGILLPETPDRGAALVSERLRVAIARWSPQTGVPLTASFGVAGWMEELDVLAEAWGALSDARDQGRDCVVVAGDDDLAS